MDSTVRLEGHDRFSYDNDALKIVLRSEGREVVKIAKRQVSRKAVSSAGDFPGQRTGLLKKTIKSKLHRSGVTIIITHNIPPGTARYPFMLAYGSEHIKPRADHLAAALNQRRSQTQSALQSALHSTILAQ